MYLCLLQCKHLLHPCINHVKQCIQSTTSVVARFRVCTLQQETRRHWRFIPSTILLGWTCHGVLFLLLLSFILECLNVNPRLLRLLPPLLRSRESVRWPIAVGNRPSLSIYLSHDPLVLTLLFRTWRPRNTQSRRLSHWFVTRPPSIIFFTCILPPQNYPGLHANREHLSNDVSHNSLSKTFFLFVHEMTPKDPRPERYSSRPSHLCVARPPF